jgi:cob(I)alamin adenosyltransferase
MEHGYVHVYTGNGKGKTTAALGLAMRAAGAGLRVFIAQFAKGQDCSELRSFARLSDRIVFRQFGSPEFIRGQPAGTDKRMAEDGLREARAAMLNGQYGVVVLDEANIAVLMGLISLDSLLAVVAAKPAQVELIITGQGAHPRLIERADLVTDMREVRHYFHRGVMARAGIEM